MRLHRFYSGPDLKLEHYVWLTEPRIIAQWRKVLRFRAGQQVILFDASQHERLYVISELKANGANLELITDLKPKTPAKDIYLFWSLLKKDKNDWVLQKATELGISHLVPILAERSEKTGFNVERAQKIVIEAAEQCGRGDIPSLREPLLLQTALHQYAKKIPLLVCQQTSAKQTGNNYAEAGVLIGPEGGWSDHEMHLFSTQEIAKISLSNFTLRAETAAIIAAQQLVV